MGGAGRPTPLGAAVGIGGDLCRALGDGGGGSPGKTAGTGAESLRSLTDSCPGKQSQSSTKASECSASQSLAPPALLICSLKPAERS